MKNKITFGQWEAVTLLINMICTKVFLNFPRTTAEIAGTASWILTLYICALAFVFFYIISKLYSRFEGRDLLDIGEYAAGSAGRIITGNIILAFFIYATSVILREFAEDMKVIIFTTAPISFVTMFFLVCMIVGAYFGIEAIVRFHAIAVPVIATGFIFIIVAVIPYSDFTNLLPILGNGPVDIFGKGFFRVSILSELVTLFLIVPFIKTNSNFKKIGYTSLGFSSFFMFISAPVYLATLNYPTGIENFLPIYQMARLINYGRFFQRVEPLFVLIWVAAALLYLASSFFFIVYIFKETYRLEYYKPLIIPFSIIIFTISLLPQNLVTAVKLETDYFWNTSWAVTFAFTIILLVIARVVKRKGRREAKECK